MEPDFGATVVIIVAVFGMIFLSGAKLTKFGVLLMIAAVLGTLLVVFQPYRFQRVLLCRSLGGSVRKWLPVDPGTHCLWSRGVDRVGLGNSVQKLMYPPEAHTDFVFAILAEEFGLLGTVSVILILPVSVYRGMKIGLRERTGRQAFFGVLGLWNIHTDWFSGFYKHRCELWHPANQRVDFTSGQLWRK